MKLFVIIVVLVVFCGFIIGFEIASAEIEETLKPVIIQFHTKDGIFNIDLRKITDNQLDNLSINRQEIELMLPENQLDSYESLEARIKVLEDKIR